ncbi:hypothetical protein F4677DRAFT_459324 [Hypoxylon crocopeplum]|nr:hypothetical protein F4677DRAFT_459324 [Hypoxylon crocopeplum]
MPAPQNKTNFRTYEASTRLLAAVLATIQGKVRLNFNEIAKMIGGGTTGSAVEHRLRPVKQLGKLQSVWMKTEKDPGDLPLDEKSTLEYTLISSSRYLPIHTTISTKIQKLFGESTAGGIEWQFRELKALGRAQQEAFDAGGDPASLKPAGQGTPGRVKGSGRSSKATSARGGAASLAGTKRKRGGNKKQVTMSEDDSEGDDDDNKKESDYDAKDRDSDNDFDDDSGLDDDLAQATPTPKRRNTGKPAAIPKIKKGSSCSVARTLFNKGNKKATATYKSIDGSEQINLVDFDEYDEDEPVAKDTTTARSSRVKTEPGTAQEDSPMKQLDPDPFFGSDGYGDDDDDLMDGEI